MKVDYSKFIVDEILSQTSVRSAIVDRWLLDKEDITDEDDLDFLSTSLIVKKLDEEERKYNQWNIEHSEAFEVAHAYELIYDQSYVYEFDSKHVLDSISFHENLKEEEYSNFACRSFYSSSGFTKDEMTIIIVSDKVESKILAWTVQFD